MLDKRKINVDIYYTEELNHVGFDIQSTDGSVLSGQDLLDAIAEAILLKYDVYDLNSPPKEMDS